VPLLLIRVLLGLEPDGDELSVDPWLPDRIDYLETDGHSGSLGQGRRDRGRRGCVDVDDRSENRRSSS
jgi:hypothetical protein